MTIDIDFLTTFFRLAIFSKKVSLKNSIIQTHFLKELMLKKILFITLLFSIQYHISFAQNQIDNCDYVYDVLLGEEESKLSDIALYQTEWLVAFYTQSDCVAAWHNSENEFANANKMRQILASYVSSEYDFHLAEIDALYTEIQTFYLPMGLFVYTETTEYDILLSDAALQLAYNLTAKSDTNDDNLESQLIRTLQEAVKQNKVGVFYENLKKGIWQPPLASDKKNTKEPNLPEKNAVNQNETTADNAPDANLKDANLTQIFEEKELEKIKVLNDTLYLPKLTKEFYEKRNFSLAWQRNATQTKAIVQTIAKAAAEGLKKEDYHFQKINNIYIVENKIDVNAKTAAEQDILLTDAILQYASHLFWGKLSAENLPFNWDIQRDEKNMAVALQKALDEKNIASFFEQQKPQHRYYQDLKQALVMYKAEAEKQDNAPAIKEGETLRLGMRDERVKALRKRLKIQEDYQNDYYRTFGLPNDSVFLTVDTLFSLEKAIAITDTSTLDEIVTLVDIMISKINTDTLNKDSLIYYKSLGFNPILFDTLVQEAVTNFQKNNRLQVDGVVGRQTLQTINMSPLDRIKQIEINLERWRWLPNDLGENYLMANIPTFMLYIFEEKDSLVLEKRTVIGKKTTQTPVFNELVRYLDLNPYWTLPHSIATAEMLPRLKRNNRYLTSKNMELFSGGKKINSTNVNWSKVSRSNFRYTIRQKPGKNNALGEVKFLFPNAYNVYVHDTPSKSLFANHERSYSHGCVRLEKPMELTEYLLRNSSKWTATKLKKQLNKKKNKRIVLDEPVPIYILYLTVISDKNGQVIFGNDIYKQDKTLMETFYSF